MAKYFVKSTDGIIEAISRAYFKCRHFAKIKYSYPYLKYRIFVTYFAHFDKSWYMYSWWHFLTYKWDKYATFIWVFSIIRSFYLKTVEILHCNNCSPQMGFQLKPLVLYSNHYTTENIEFGACCLSCKHIVRFPQILYSIMYH